MNPGKLFNIKNLVYGLSLVPFLSMGQLKIADTVNYEIYYIGINPVAPFTSIRSETTSLYLPALSGRETGISAFVGKIWNRKYNVETRLSFGSPLKSYNLLLVQSGFMYRFNSGKQHIWPYLGAFINIYSLHNLDTKSDKVSAITYLCIGNRFIRNKYFLDLRLNQNIYALSWTDQHGSKARHGFHPSIYKWKSNYIPYAVINIGYMFR